jgi:hypothetical protein
MGPKKLKAMERWNLVIGALFTLIATVAFSTPMALGVAIGAIVCCANFWSIRKIWESLLSAKTERQKAMQVLFLLKTMALIAVVFVAVRFLPIDPIGFALGISVFLISIAIESLRFVLGRSSVEI